ncbi:hypothetical protein [Lentzea albida]|uniref:Secreted protein n=1 Tax=Lentzea albida TaxID=65499 RepID=A0A1H9WSW5_9PSEU|nr:hypothetical protein [Lentzea albida]SES37030.1 hypothetical protein SAMN04488000_12487 [Lentzea albida]
MRSTQLLPVVAAATACLVLAATPGAVASTCPGGAAPRYPAGGVITIEYRLPALTNPAACGTPPALEFQVVDGRNTVLASLSGNSYPGPTGAPQLTWSADNPGTYYVTARFPRPACPVDAFTDPIATGRSLGQPKRPTTTAWRGFSFSSAEVSPAPAYKQINGPITFYAEVC